MEYSWKKLSPAEAAAQSSGGDPAKLPWGFFSSDDRSIGGAGMFSWFGTAKELLAFVSEVILSLPEAGDVETEAKIKRCRERIANLQTPDSALLEDINEVLDSEDFGIEWWGNFDQLCEAGDEFSKQMRIRYHDPDGDSEEEDCNAIDKASRENFAQFVSEYSTGG